MPRLKRARRFEPRYGVSQAILDVEAGYVAREAEDYAVLAASDLDRHRIERHANSRHSWEQFQNLLEHLDEREQRVIECLLFRDIHQLLELYLTFVRPKVPVSSTTSSPLVRKPERLEFTEWLFDPPPS